jgi:lipoprotein-anchoring transpeptidase ErfK/SrfK
VREQHRGWTTLAVLVMVRVLAGDREAAAQIDGRREAVPGASPRRIVVSLAERKLAVVDDGRVLRVFNVAVGAPSSPSPVGRFTIVNRLENPGYYTPGKAIAPGPSNPLGTRWMGLDVKGYGIHGTDQPGSIGHARSHGCIRLRNRDVEELFALVREGDVVELHGDRTPELSFLFDAAASQPELRVAATARVN